MTDFVDKLRAFDDDAEEPVKPFRPFKWVNIHARAKTEPGVHVTDALRYAVHGLERQVRADFDRVLLGDTGPKPPPTPWWRTWTADQLERVMWWAMAQAERLDGRRFDFY